MQQISVVIPTLNEEAAIGSLIECLRRQSELDIIVSDGGSSDNTAAICEAYGVKLVSGAPGRGGQMNRGAEAACGGLILFLHADSIVDPAVWDQMREAAAEGHKWGCLTLAFTSSKGFYRRLAFFSNWRAILLSSCYGDQGIWCEREFFWQQGGFPDYPLMEDLAFSHRLRRLQKARVLKASITTSTRRFEAGGRWKVLLKMQQLKLLYWLGVSPARLAARYR